MTYDKLFFIAAGVFIFAVVLDFLGLVLKHEKIGYYLGLVSILLLGVWFLVPLFTCHSPDPIGCEWAGVGIIILGGLTLGMLAIFWLVSLGVAWTWNRRGSL